LQSLEIKYWGVPYDIFESIDVLPVGGGSL
jgi:hypothetical protein